VCLNWQSAAGILTFNLTVLKVCYQRKDTACVLIIEGAVS